MLWIILALILFIVQIAAVVIFEFSRPYKAVTWMVILFLCPPMGFLLYFFVGKEYACKRLMNREDRMLLKQIKEQLSDR